MMSYQTTASCKNIPASCKNSRAIASSSSNYTTIHADELTEGDIIKHFTGDTWLVISEPEYTCSGITFEVLWLDVDSADNTQSVCFAPNWRFELVDHQSARQQLAA